MTESRYKLEFSSGYLFHSMEIGIIVAKKNSCAILIQMRTDYLFFFFVVVGHQQARSPIIIIQVRFTIFQ